MADNQVSIAAREPSIRSREGDLETNSIPGDLRPVGWLDNPLVCLLELAADDPVRHVARVGFVVVALSAVGCDDLAVVGFEVPRPLAVLTFVQEPDSRSVVLPASPLPARTEPVSVRAVACVAPFA